MMKNMGMKKSRLSMAFAVVTLVTGTFLALTVNTGKAAAQKQGDEELLRARETVWRTYFAGDTKALEPMVPPGTIVMSGGEEKWRGQADVLKSAAEFHAKGGKLIRLEFPRTEVQHFGDVAIIWSSYIVETEMDGKRAVGSSRVTEIFVRQNGRWTNPGWHTDEEK
jgi:ketosteroid isomerase-like protein